MTAYNKVNGDYAGGERAADRGGAQGRVGLPGLGDVRLGRDAELGLRARGARPGVAASQIDVLIWGAEPFTEPLRAALRATGELPQRAPVGDGAAHPALDVRGRHRRVGAAPPEVDIGRARRDRARGRAPGHRAAARTTASCRSPPTPSRAHRGDRRPRAARRARAGTGSSAVVPPGGYAAEVTDRRPGRAWASMRNLYLLPSSPVEELREAAARGGDRVRPRA